MNALIRNLAHAYYTELILSIILIATLITSIRKRKFYPALKFIPLYTSAFLLLNFTDWSLLVISIPGRARSYIVELENYIVTIIELFTFYYFFLKTIKNKKLRKMLTIFSRVSILFFALMTTPVLKIETLYSSTELNRIYLFELFILALFCAFFFIDHLYSQPVKAITSNADFWISSSIFLYAIGTLPLTIISTYYIKETYRLYEHFHSLIYVLYIFILFTVMLGYYRKQKEQKSSLKLYSSAK